MSDLPATIEIHEEGPREGFQIEPGPISTADKIRVIEALAETGIAHIQVCSFVNPRLVPGWADAEAVVSGFKAKPGIHYTALWFNAAGLERALAFRDKLQVTGAISLTASEGFTRKNLNRSHAENVAAMRKQTALHLERGVPVKRIGVMAAFGCNYQGDITPAQVVSTLEDGLSIAKDAGTEITLFSLADTMGWATPARIERTLGEVRSRWPDKEISLHLHDTRGLAVANAHAGLRMGVLPVRGPEGRRRQHLHRGAGAAVRGNGHSHRHRPRQAHRGRPPRRDGRRSPAAERIDPRREPRRLPPQGRLSRIAP
jgi:isopropylmalate/homocitrate/citramalate synthase